MGEMQSTKDQQAVAIATQQAQAVVAQRAQSAPIEFAPENVNEAYRYAVTLAKSDLLPKTLRNKPADVLVILLTGRELGMTPMQSIRGMHVIEGRGQLSAESMAALVQTKTDICEYFAMTESTSERATYSTLRKGHPQAVSISYTMDDAKRANLTGKDNWKSHPAAMLRARASSALARAVYPDIIGGFYTEDEMDEVRGRGGESRPALEIVIPDQPTGVIASPQQSAEIVDADVVNDHQPTPQKISEPQAKRFHAIATAREKTLGIKGIAAAVLSDHGIGSASDILLSDYDGLVKIVESYETEAGAREGETE